MDNLPHYLHFASRIVAGAFFNADFYGDALFEFGDVADDAHFATL